ALASEAAPAARGSRLAAFLRGALTNLSNPKSAVYFGSIFALFLKPGTPVWVQITAVGVVLANTLLWYGAVALLFSSAAVQRWYAAARRPLDRAAGVLMIAFGARLILVRDPLPA
ncbi:MAG: LysE family transporter, partial [Thermoanaerobaculia bacterium]